MKRLILNTSKMVAIGAIGLGSIVTFNASADGWDVTGVNTNATNIGSIVNTRHNFTFSYATDFTRTIMSSALNNYGEVCVYCHTPHAANSQINAPLWNRTINSGTYTVYDKPRTLNRPIGQPGPNSLTCLSCHDGTIAIDSVLNMPGSGRYGNNETGTSDQAFLSTWAASGMIGPTGTHFKMGDPAGAANAVAPETCANAACHSSQADNRPDFRIFTIGMDLRDDHPIGIQYPEGPYGADIGVDFFEPYKGFTSVSGTMWFHDTDGDQYPDKNEPRMYDSGDAVPEVECASCHDPHGVPIAGPESEFIPSFLRVSNGNVNTGEGRSSGLCLTCHIK